MFRVLAFLKGQNTHLAWWLGIVVTSICGFTLLGGKMTMEAWSEAHLDGFAKTVNAGIEGLAIVALYAWFPALIGAAIGRPPYIPQRGGPFVAKDE